MRGFITISVKRTYYKSASTPAASTEVESSSIEAADLVEILEQAAFRFDYLHKSHAENSRLSHLAVTARQLVKLVTELDEVHPPS